MLSRAARVNRFHKQNTQEMLDEEEDFQVDSDWKNSPPPTLVLDSPTSDKRSVESGTASTEQINGNASGMDCSK